MSALTSLAKTLTFGVELEVLGPHDMTVVLARELRGKVVGSGPEFTVESPLGSWRSVVETSLNTSDAYPCGREFVSPILHYGSAVDRAVPAAMLRAMGRCGFGVDDACGLHVHVGVGDRARDPILILSALALSFEWSRLVHALLRDVRLESIFCEAHTRWYMGLLADYFTGAKPLSYCRLMRVVLDQDPREVNESTDKQNLPRNFGVNLTALPRHGTIEYRFFAGTMDPDTALAYVEFCVRFTALVMLEPPCLRPPRDPTEANAEELLARLGLSEPASAILFGPEVRAHLHHLERRSPAPLPTLDLTLLDECSRRLVCEVVEACHA